MTGQGRQEVLLFYGQCPLGMADTEIFLASNSAQEIYHGMHRQYLTKKKVQLGIFPSADFIPQMVQIHCQKDT